MNIKKSTSKQKFLTVILGGLILFASAGAIYLNDYYRADSEAIQAFLPQNNIHVTLPNLMILLDFS